MGALNKLYKNTYDIFLPNQNDDDDDDDDDDEGCYCYHIIIMMMTMFMMMIFIFIIMMTMTMNPVVVFISQFRQNPKKKPPPKPLEHTDVQHKKQTTALQGRNRRFFIEQSW